MEARKTTLQKGKNWKIKCSSAAHTHTKGKLSFVLLNKAS